MKVDQDPYIMRFYFEEQVMSAVTVSPYTIVVQCNVLMLLIKIMPGFHAHSVLNIAL